MGSAVLADALDALEEVLESAVAAGDVPGVIVAVADGTGISFCAAGRREIGSDQPLAVDALCRIASMIKLVTSVAALQFVEEGALDLDLPVGEYVPEFDELLVLEGFDGETPKPRSPTRRATVRQLCNHTAGCSYDRWDERLARYQRVQKRPGMSARQRVAFQAPLVADPGEGCLYVSTDWLGLVIESVTRRRLPERLHDFLFVPRGMADTTMLLSPEQGARRVPLHERSSDGSWIACPIPQLSEPEFFAGGHGLYATASDFSRLQLALLRGGELDGKRILGRALAQRLFSYDPDEPVFEGLGWRRGRCAVEKKEAQRWGLAFPVSPRPGTRGRLPGSGGWSGNWNTFYWFDPAAGLAAGFYTQTATFYDPGVLATLQTFEATLYSRLRPARARSAARTGSARED